MSSKIPVSQVNPDDNCSNCPPMPRRFAADSSRSTKSQIDSLHAEPCSWFEVHHLMREIAGQLKRRKRKFNCILAISTGGIIPAKLLAEELGICDIRLIPIKDKQIVHDLLPRLDKDLRYVVVDDIRDSGATARMVSEILNGYYFEFAFCMSRYPDFNGTSGRILNHKRWIIFPWEKEAKQLANA